jgi:hypothetical protein
LRRAAAYGSVELQPSHKEQLMNAAVVCESTDRNTRAVAQAVAEGLGGVPVVPVHVAAREEIDVELIVVGGPTHLRGLATARSRHVALAGAQRSGAEPVPSDAAEEPGLHAWLRDLHRHEGTFAAAFDTRLDTAPWLTGAAARGIARRLRRHGYELVSIASFLVDDAPAPVTAGELDRARAWGEGLARSLAARGGSETTTAAGAGTR